MPEACLLALDLGTTTCRCIAFDLQGRPLASAATEIALAYPAPGRAEADPETWWAAACRNLNDVATQLAVQHRQPLALGLTGLKHAVVPLDRNGGVLAPAMLWMDQRCRPQVDELNTHYAHVVAQVIGPGARVSTTPSLPKLRWWRENRPELLDRAQHLLLPKDWIRYRLTGTMATDASDAGGTMQYDSATDDWSPDLVELAGIEPSQLPPIRPPDSVAGRVNPQAARETGLPPDLPVVIGMGDVQATVLGTGGARPGRALIYMGTAAWIHWVGTRDRTRILATATTGAALRWLRDVLGGPEGLLSYDTLMAEAADVAPGAEGLIFLPHLCGERGPIPDPDARGSLTGLSLRHGRGHLARAVLEGTSCHLRWLLEACDGDGPAEVWAAGGAAHSPFWIQILCDLLGRPVHTPHVVEAGALGAAILSAVGAKLYEGADAAATAMVREGNRYQPDAAQSATYEAVYRRWRAEENRPMASSEDQGGGEECRSEST